MIRSRMLVAECFPFAKPTRKFLTRITNVVVFTGSKTNPQSFEDSCCNCKDPFSSYFSKCEY